jgi:septum formation protein
MQNPRLVLASTSPYRRELLMRLAWPFDVQKPLFDEDAAKARAPREPQAHAAFLARGKAESLLPWLKETYPQESKATILGGDQLVAFENQILGKPGGPEKAIQQLTKMNGKMHALHTAMCVIQGGRLTEWVHTTRLQMRKLTPSQIQEYVRLDEPYDSAGSYKIEKHGIALFDQVDCDDWSAIQGIPLLELSRVLVRMGFTPLSGLSSGDLK